MVKMYSPNQRWTSYGKGSFTVSLIASGNPTLLNTLQGFWMSDKPLVQQALASELAEMILTISSTAASLAFLRGFWETTVREWNGIDRLRCVVNHFSIYS